MKTPQQLLALSKYEGEILELIEENSDYDYSDLQARVSAIVLSIVNDKTL